MSFSGFKFFINNTNSSGPIGCAGQTVPVHIEISKTVGPYPVTYKAKLKLVNANEQKDCTNAINTYNQLIDKEYVFNSPLITPIIDDFLIIFPSSQNQINLTKCEVIDWSAHPGLGQSLITTGVYIEPCGMGTCGLCPCETVCISQTVDLPSTRLNAIVDEQNIYWPLENGVFTDCIVNSSGTRNALIKIKEKLLEIDTFYGGCTYTTQPTVTAQSIPDTKGNCIRFIAKGFNQKFRILHWGGANDSAWFNHDNC